MSIRLTGFGATIRSTPRSTSSNSRDVADGFPFGSASTTARSDGSLTHRRSSGCGSGPTLITTSSSVDSRPPRSPCPCPAEHRSAGALGEPETAVQLEIDTARACAPQGCSFSERASTLPKAARRATGAARGRQLISEGGSVRASVSLKFAFGYLHFATVQTQVSAFVFPPPSSCHKSPGWSPRCRPFSA